MRITWTPAEAFKDITRGNVAAEELMAHLYRWFHYRDDLFDKDKVVPASSCGFDLALLQTFSKNPFFQKHQDYLWPVFTMATLAWIASESLKNAPDVLDRLTGQVLKSQYQDYFFAVAYCVGGFDHALEMARKYRGYCFDDDQPKLALGKAIE
jgi:hypothetical protein